MGITGSTAVEIAHSIRALVQHGALRPGDGLPPVRALAESLAINRNTVAAAYRRLVQAGIAVTQGRNGTSICKPVGAGEQEGISQGTPLVDLADGNPNPTWLPDPVALMARLASRPFLYGDDTVLAELRVLADRWFKADCPPNWTLAVTHGAVDAVERLATAHLVPGEKVAVEDPGFLGTIGALRVAGMKAVGVAVDEYGMRPDALRAALAFGVQAVLVTPRAHNPTGCSLTRRRAKELRDVLAAFPATLVIVDDHYALLAETAYHSIFPAGAQRWALVRSVSKGFGPDLRVALVACDVDTGERLRARLAPGTTWVSRLLQGIVAAGLSDDDTLRRLQGGRDDYAKRRERLRQALMDKGLALPAATSGFNLWVPLTSDAKNVGYEMARRGWLVRLGNAFDVQGTSQAIRVTVSRLEPGDVAKFANDLAASIR
jgi:DNA-binding transcriptional MocR family regulator